MENRWGSNGNSDRFYFKITADGECSHEIKRCLLLERKGMTNLDSTLKIRDITLLPKVCIVKVMVFPVFRYECESWTIKKAECRRTDAFKLWYWRRLLRVPWTAGRSSQSILKKISPEYLLEGLMLKQTRMLGKSEGWRRRGWQRMRWLDAISDWRDMSRETSEWWTRMRSVLQSMRSQRLGHNWVS